jgi:hypothetical protein
MQEAKLTFLGATIMHQQQVASLFKEAALAVQNAQNRYEHSMSQVPQQGLRGLLQCGDSRGSQALATLAQAAQMRSGSQFLDSLRVFERGQPSATKMACDFTKLGHSYRQASLSLATRYMHLHANVFLESKLALEQQQSVSLRQLCNGLSTAMVMPPNAQYSCLATRQLFTAAKVYKREVLRAVAEYEAKKASLLKESQAQLSDVATPPFLNYVFGVAENGLEGLDMLQLSTVPEQQVDAIPTTAAPTTTTTNSDAKVPSNYQSLGSLVRLTENGLAGMDLIHKAIIRLQGSNAQEKSLDLIVPLAQEVMQPVAWKSCQVDVVVEAAAADQYLCCLFDAAAERGSMLNGLTMLREAAGPEQLVEEVDVAVEAAAADQYLHILFDAVTEGGGDFNGLTMLQEAAAPEQLVEEVAAPERLVEEVPLLEDCWLNLVYNVADPAEELIGLDMLQSAAGPQEPEEQVVEVTEPPQGIGALFAAGASSCGIKALTMAHEMGTKNISFAEQGNAMAMSPAMQALRMSRWPKDHSHLSILFSSYV